MLDTIMKYWLRLKPYIPFIKSTVKDVNCVFNKTLKQYESVKAQQEAVAAAAGEKVTKAEAQRLAALNEAVEAARLASKIKQLM